MSTRLFVLFSESLDDDYLCDTGEDAKTFLGAHTSLEKAQAFARGVYDADFSVAVEEDEELGDPSPRDRVELTWTSETYEAMPHVNRTQWTSSDTDLGFRFSIQESFLDPRIDEPADPTI